MTRSTGLSLVVMAIGAWGLASSVPPTQTKPKPRAIYTQEDLDRKIAAVQKEAEEKVLAAQKAAEARVKEAEDSATKRIDEMAKAADDKIKKVLAAGATPELAPFAAETGKWYQIENSDGLMRCRDPLLTPLNSTFSLELDIPDRRLYSPSSRSGLQDMEFFVTVFNKDKKPIGRTRVSLGEVPLGGGHYPLYVPLMLSEGAFYSIRYNSDFPSPSDSGRRGG